LGDFDLSSLLSWVKQNPSNFVMANGQTPTATATPSTGYVDSTGSWFGDLLTTGTETNIGAFGGKDINGNNLNGWANTGLGVANAALGAWQSMQQMDLARDQLAFQKDAFAKNWAAQRKTTNSALADRQNARLGANPTGYESLDSYMAKNGI
jgi:hypothetical protein